MTYKKCDKPLRTCLGLNEFSDELVERGVAEEISIEEAKKALRLADEHGLVHQPSTQIGSRARSLTYAAAACT